MVRLSHTGGSPFDLLSIVVGNNSLANATSMTGSNGASRTVVDSHLGLGISFGAPWQNLTWVDITVASAPCGAPEQFTGDNYLVRTVPGPGAGSAFGLAGAVGLRGRRRPV